MVRRIVPIFLVKSLSYGFRSSRNLHSLFLIRYKQELLQYFDDRVEANSDVMSKAISLWENLLEQQQRRDRQTQK